METKHTKGEWRFTGETASIFGSIIGKNFKISINNPSNSEERIANAKLIAAAPDLLEALNELLLDIEADKYNYRLATMKKAKEAINKATK